MANDRISQLLAEAIVSPTSGKARVSQAPFEIAVSPTSAKARVTQESVEAAVLPTSAKARTSQFVVEVIMQRIPQVYGQCQAYIAGVVETRAHAQAQADIKQTYTDKTGQAQATIRGNAFGQAQSDIKATSFGLGQAQAEIKATSNAVAQSQADIKQTYNQHGQTQATLSVVSFAYGQAQAKINAFGVCQFGQANCYVLGAAQQFSQSQADIKQTSYGLGQAQTDIKATLNVHGQCQADIKQTYQVVGQCQADIKATSNQHGQCQADIKATSNSHGQAQGSIKNTFTGFGQCQAKIRGIYNLYAQCQASISSQITLRYGQAQATVTPQYIHFLDTFTRSVAVVNSKLNLNPPDYGIYSGNSSVIPDGSIDGTKLVIPYRDFFATEYLANVPVDITGESTLSMEFRLTDYVSIDDFYFEVSIGQAGVLDGYIGMFTDAGEMFLFAGTNFVSAPFVPGNGFTYRFLLFAGHTEAKAKWWLVNDGIITYPEPSDWNLTVTPNVSFVGQEAFFDTHIFGPLGETMEVDNVSVYAPEPPAWLAFGQALGFIRRTIAHGQAKAQIKKLDNNKHGNTQASIRKSAGRGQAQALITKIVFRSAQAQARITTTTPNGQAQATIITTRPNGQGQAWILNRWFPAAQANSYIIEHHRWFGQTQGEIKVQYVTHGLALAYIFRAQGYGQAQAYLSAESTTGQAQGYVKSINRVHAQARTFINKTIKSGQAQAFLASVRSHGLAQAYIQDRRQKGQAQGRIRLPAGFGQCQAFIGNKTARTVSGQAASMIRYIYVIFGQTQAMLAKRNGHGQANARMKAFGTRGYGQCQAFILATAIIQPYGQAQASIRRSVGSGQTQGFVSGGRYLVRFNSYALPGYAQSESYASIESLEPQYATYKDSSMTEYVGLQNKIISLRMKVLGETYSSVKDQVQEAATIMLSSKQFTKLYIQRSDRYYEAIGNKLTTEKEVRESMRTLDYNIEFHAKPWLTSDAIHTINGTGTITTDSTGRAFANGGWTPAKIIISGTNVTVSGYTATGDFTGFVSVSGAVSSLEIDAVTYSAEISGINYNNGMKNPDYAVYVGPGKTTFVITGASSCQIEWQDRWYL